MGGDPVPGAGLSLSLSRLRVGQGLARVGHVRPFRPDRPGRRRDPDRLSNPDLRPGLCVVARLRGVDRPHPLPQSLLLGDSHRFGARLSAGGSGVFGGRQAPPGVRDLDPGVGGVAAPLPGGNGLLLCRSGETQRGLAAPRGADGNLAARTVGAPVDRPDAGTAGDRPGRILDGSAFRSDHRVLAVEPTYPVARLRGGWRCSTPRPGSCFRRSGSSHC